MKVINLNPIAKARKRIWDTLENDPDFRLAYEANIAMLLHDLYGGIFKDFNTRNDAAKAILKLIFN